MTRTLPRICRPLRRCGDWRRCDYCARARQATIASRAEALAGQFDTLFISVLTPADKTQAGIQRVRAALLRKAFAPAGLWSVEEGEKAGGLHLNIIAPAPAPDTLRDCSTWAQAITTSARAAAAYINKREGFPDPSTYTGNLTGSWSRIPDLFTSRHMPPTIQAASIEAAISNKRPEEYLRAALASREREQQAAVLTRADYHEIARRNLPNLYAILAGRQPGED